MQDKYNFSETEIEYLQLLGKEYPNIQSVCEEIINLRAILNLPKGTELFLSDIHGEYESFLHILNNGSGVIKNKIERLFANSLSETERKTLATLIYYPEEKLKIIKEREKNLQEFYNLVLYRLIEVCRAVSTKYTRSKVRKAIPKEFEYVLDEVLHSQGEPEDKQRYYREIIRSIIETEMAEEFIITISNVIKRMAIDHLHIVGDVYDRGGSPDKVMEFLCNHHSIDMQWGNHDILWMGAMCGSEVCIPNVLRVCARYDNLDILEESYGINLRPLTTFALETYKDDECKRFIPKTFEVNKYSASDKLILSKIQKASAIMQFKLEGQMIMKHPEYGMEDRLIIDKINKEKGTVTLNNGKEYELNDKNFPTIDPDNPYELNSGEKEVIERLQSSFLNSEKLHKHVKFLYAKGGMYTIFNSNLLFHGCLPMNQDGEFTELNIWGKKLKGKALLDAFDKIARIAYFENESHEKKQDAVDMMWYLWCAPNSPLFGKDKAATFERYFIDDKDTHYETKNPYYALIENAEMCDKVFDEFGIDKEKAHIISGHIPVKCTKGEKPVKADGKFLIIDGGLAKGYRKETGIAGYNLTYNSYGLLLSANQPFESKAKAISEEEDMISEIVVKQQLKERQLVNNTDVGTTIKKEINNLKRLLSAYRQGIIKSRIQK